MSFALLPTRRLMPLALGVAALFACECERDAFSLLPDAGTPDAAQAQQDAGPPPPEFPLKAGDLIEYLGMGVTFCNESFSTTCTEHSNNWRAQFTIQEPGPSLDPGTNAWVVPAEYYWQVSEKKSPDPAIFQTLSQLWLTDFGPWESPAGASESVIRNFTTTTVMLENGPLDSFPFFDVEARFDTAAQEFEAYIRSKDPEPFLQIQKAARKFSAGYLEPSDQTQLHFISIIYHRLGFVCSVSESIGPWAGGSSKSESSFASNQRDYKSTFTGPVRLTRAADGQGRFCQCGTGAGSDCQ